MDRSEVPTNRERLHRRIVDRARSDPEWAEQLQRDPKSALEAELGVTLPEHLNVVLVRETAGLMCIVLPHHLGGMQEDAAVSLRGAGRRKIGSPRTT